MQAPAAMLRATEQDDSKHCFKHQGSLSCDDSATSCNIAAVKQACRNILCTGLLPNAAHVQCAGYHRQRLPTSRQLPAWQS